MNILTSFVTYMNNWFLIAFVMLMSIVCDKIYRKGANFMFGRRKKVFEGIGLRFAMKNGVILPAGASKAAIWFPCAAVASLVTVCAALPYCSFMPIIENDSDIMQLIYSMLLSEVFALASLFMLKTNEAFDAVRAEAAGAIKLFITLSLFFASLAYYLTCNGLDTDAFSLNSFSTIDALESMSVYGRLGTAIFVAAVLAAIPQHDIYSGTLLLTNDELRDYDGVPRILIQLWSVLRSFIVISFISFVAFPTDYLTSVSADLGIAWHGQMLNFIVFWAVVILMRLILVPLYTLIIIFLEKRAKRFAPFVFPAVVSTAMLLIWYEGIILSQEAASY